MTNRSQWSKMLTFNHNIIPSPQNTQRESFLKRQVQQVFFLVFWPKLGTKSHFGIFDQAPTSYLFYRYTF